MMVSRQNTFAFKIIISRKFQPYFLIFYDGEFSFIYMDVPYCHIDQNHQTFTVHVGLIHGSCSRAQSLQLDSTKPIYYSFTFLEMEIDFLT